MLGIGNRFAPRDRPLPIRRFLVAGFFIFSILFQIFQYSRFQPLYFFLKIIFILELVLFAWEFLRLSRKNKAVLLIVLLVIVVRLPFLLHSNGLMFMSDNAMEAIQAWDIKDTRLVPFYLLDTLPQHGVMKHLMIAFIWDILGVSYLSVVLFQLFLYLIFLHLFGDIFQRIFDRRTVILLLLGQFAFIEVLFDSSLFLRAGTYLEMLVVFLLGVALFDFHFRDRKRLFLSVYFLCFAYAINPSAVCLAAPFAGAAIIAAASRLRDRRVLLPLAFGLLAGILTPLYGRFVLPPPPETGHRFEVNLIPLSGLGPSHWPKVLTQLVRDAHLAFRNILGFEFDYAHAVAPRFEFRPESQTVRTAFSFIHEALIIAGAIVLALGLFLALHRLWRVRRTRFHDLPWIIPFYFFLIATFLGRLVLFAPKPFLEPRHNLDLALILIISLAWTADAIIRRRPTRQPIWTAVAVLGSFLLAFPQGSYFYKSAVFRDMSYSRILSVLRRHNVRNLATDFTIAHCLYFLSGRKVRVTDSIGPITLSYNLPWLTRIVDSLPAEHKAYLLYTEKYPGTYSVHIKIPRIRKHILDELTRSEKPYRIVDLFYYELIIPQASRGTTEPDR